MVNPTDAARAANTLHLNDDSSTSRMTQLDIENVDETNPGTDDVDDSDMDDLPPLSTYLAGWKFWFQFAIWPFVFLLLNGVVVSTLVAFDEYEFQYGKRRSHRSYRNYNEFDEEIMNRERNGSIAYDMMKYNRTIIAILLFIDAFIIYRAVIFLDKKIRELDLIGDTNQDDTNQFLTSSTSPTLKPNVPAQVSRKLDAVLGRNPQSRISIFISILWLLFVGCGTVGLVSIADLLFALSPKGKQVCTGEQQKSSTPASSPIYYTDVTGDNEQFDDDMYNQGDKTFNVTQHIDNIPDELQKWAHTRHDMYARFSNVVHLTNGMNYFSATNPSEGNTDIDWEMRHMYGMPGNQLVSTSVGGNLTFYNNVLEPYALTSTGGDNLLNSSGFCCLYRSYAQGTQSKNEDFYSSYHTFDISMLCTRISDTLGDGVLPNATLFKQKSNRQVQVNFEAASIKSFSGQIYVQVISSSYDNNRKGTYKSGMTFYNVSFGTNTMTLNQIAETSETPQIEYPSSPFLVGPDSNCYRWTKNIDLIVFLVVLGAASMWLTKMKNLSVGIVPGVIAISMTLSRISHELSLAISSLSTLAVFLGLAGCINIPVHREKLIWALYTLLLCVASLIFMGRFYYYYDSFYNFERALVTIAIASLIGFMLNHPVLYLFGWIGGIWAVFCGIFIILTPNYGGTQPHEGVFAICLGIIVGSGCVTVGFNLTKYRAHIVYYSKRAWFAMNAAIQSNNTNQRGSRNNQSSTSRSTRYAPVMHTSQDPMVNVQDPKIGGGNDITASLLNQSSEGRTRSH